MLLPEVNLPQEHAFNITTGNLSPLDRSEISLVLYPYGEGNHILSLSGGCVAQVFSFPCPAKSTKPAPYSIVSIIVSFLRF